MSDGEPTTTSNPQSPSESGMGWGGVPWFISVAFTAAIVFGPIVIATGLLTSTSPTAQGFPDISVAALRSSLDAGPFQLRLNAD